MKNVKNLLLLIAILAMASCSSRDEKMQKLAQDYLSSQLKEASVLFGNVTIDNVEFGKVDSLFESFDESPEGEAMKSQVDSLKSVSNETGDVWLYRTQKYRDKAYNAQKVYDMKNLEYFNNILTYKGEFKGWSLGSKVKLFDASGKSAEDSVYFYFNKEGDKVVGMETTKAIKERKDNVLKVIRLTKELYNLK